MKKNLLLILLLLSLPLLTNCKDWEKDVNRNGIYFKKIHQSKSGNYIGFIPKNQVIQGFPCQKGWVHFQENWKLLSFQLNQKYTFNKTVLPAHTWIHFPNQKDRTGYICVFPTNFKVQGFVCRGSGGYSGIHTGFYKNGRLRSFFAPENILIKGIPCKKSLFTNINLYKSGELKSCKLFQDIEIKNQKYEKGLVIHFDEKGNVISK